MDLTPFIRSYLATAEWAELEYGAPRRGWSRSARKVAEQKCRRFIELVRAEFTPSEAEAILSREAVDLDYLWPHELWLTARGHGAGFWDRSKNWDDYAPDASQRLTKLAAQVGDAELYVGRGGWMYLT